MPSGRRRILVAEIVASLPPPIAIATFSDGTVTKTATGWTGPGLASNWPSTILLSSGQYYWETIVSWTANGDALTGFFGNQNGFGNGAVPLGSQQQTGNFDVRSVGIGKSGIAAPSGVSVGAIASGSKIRSWLDMDAKIYRVAVNDGPWVVIASLDNDSWPYYVDDSVVHYYDTVQPGASLYNQTEFGVDTSTVTENFGATPFTYAVPDGVSQGVIGPNGSATPVNINLSSETVDGDGFFYDSRIAGDESSDVEMERQASCYVWNSDSVSRRGKLVVINADGALDIWTSYAWRDAIVTLKSGYNGDDISDFTVWSVNRVDSIVFTDNLRVEINLADPLVLLDKALQDQFYPSDQPNAQIVGKPLPIVYGAPLYCTGIRLNTSDLYLDYQLTDTISSLDSITYIYDNGDVFWGPDDPFTPHAAITDANGGDFLTWASRPAVPSGNQTTPLNWQAYTPFTTTDAFIEASGGGCRMLSSHQAATVMYHNVNLRDNTRYQITFNVVAIPVPGDFYLVAGPVSVPVPVTATGAVTMTLDTNGVHRLHLMLDGTPVDISIRNLRASAIQVIDWNYYIFGYGFNVGFTLANKPAGKIVANPVNSLNNLSDIISDANERLQIPDVGLLPGIDMDSVSAIQSAAPYTVAKYLTEPATALAHLKDVIDTWCGWITSNLQGQIVFGRVAPPGNTPVLTLDDTNVVDEIVISDDLAKGLTLTLTGGRNNSPHSDNDIADSVSDDLKSTLMSEMTLSCIGAPALTEGAVSAAYAQAILAPAKQTLIQVKSQLQAEANRIATIWRTNRKFYNLVAILDATQADTLEPGQTVRVVWPRYGLDAGKNLLVVGVQSRFFSRRVNLTLWG